MFQRDSSCIIRFEQEVWSGHLVPSPSGLLERNLFVSHTQTMSDLKSRWRRLLRAWSVGPASLIEHARQFTARYPDRFEGWIVLADAFWNFASYREAQSALRTAERLIPAKLKYQMCEQWGLLYKEKNDLRRAENWFRKGLKAKPSTRRHIFLGSVLAKQGRLAEAKAQYRAAIRRATDGEPVDEAHFNLALILRAEGKYKQAVQHLKKALSIDSNYNLAREALRDVQRATSFVDACCNEMKSRKRGTVTTIPEFGILDCGNRSVENSGIVVTVPELQSQNSLARSSAATVKIKG